jgi:hypothetical protein
MRRDLQAMEQVGSSRFVCQVEIPGASPLGPLDRCADASRSSGCFAKLEAVSEPERLALHHLDHLTF